MQVSKGRKRMAVVLFSLKKHLLCQRLSAKYNHEQLLSGVG